MTLNLASDLKPSTSCDLFCWEVAGQPLLAAYPSKNPVDEQERAIKGVPRRVHLKLQLVQRWKTNKGGALPVSS